MVEGEPDNGPGYVDEYNGGCNAPNGQFQPLTGDEYGNLNFCGVSGWNGSGTRDTDWYLVTFGDQGTITWGNFDFTMTFTGLAPGVVATQSVALDAVKTMYR